MSKHVILLAWPVVQNGVIAKWCIQEGAEWGGEYRHLETRDQLHVAILLALQSCAQQNKSRADVWVASKGGSITGTRYTFQDGKATGSSDLTKPTPEILSVIHGAMGHGPAQPVAKPAAAKPKSQKTSKKTSQKAIASKPQPQPRKAREAAPKKTSKKGAPGRGPYQDFVKSYILNHPGSKLPDAAAAWRAAAGA